MYDASTAHLTPRKIIAIYILVAALWVAFSDYLLPSLAAEIAILDHLRAYKDWLFILVTAAVLYIYIQRNYAVSRDSDVAIRESEQRYRDVAESASDWIWEMDENLRFSYLSDQFYLLTGIPPKKVLKHTRWELASTHPEPEPEKWRQHRQLLEQHLPFRDFIYQILLADRQGRTHHFKISGKPIYDKQGKFKGYRGMGTDITEQRRTEQALQESETRLRRIIDMVPHMIFAKDRNGRFLLANQAVAEAYGTTVEQLVDRPHKAVHPVKQEVKQMLVEDLEVIETGRSKFIPEETFTDHAGNIRILQTTKIPFTEPSSDEPALLGVAIDITEQKRAEQETAHMRLYLKNIIDSMPSVLLGVDLEGKITEWNQQAEQMSGLTWEQAQGRHFGEVFPQLEIEQEQLQTAIQKRRPIKPRRLTLNKQGDIHYVDVMVYPLIADSAIGAVIRLDDVTARVRIEEMMMETEKMLSVGGLAAGMAHEINNPLGAILQGSQNIQRRLSPDMPKNRQVAEALGLDLEVLNRYLQERKILRFLEGIREAGSRAAKIVSDMLSFSRRSEPCFTDIDPRELLDTVVRLATNDYDLKKRYDFKQIRIERDYDPDLIWLHCDKTEIEQVILNLIKNAAQAMASDKTAAPTIILRTRREPRHACIEVIDNGPGMDEHIRKRAFEPFFTTKEVGVGTGLGLSVSYFIITEQHKGSLSVISQPGQGACFTIRLPLEV